MIAGEGSHRLVGVEILKPGDSFERGIEAQVPSSSIRLRVMAGSIRSAH
jgi:hypothetical protein